MGALELTKYIPLLINRQSVPIPVPTSVTSVIVRGGTKGRARHLGDKGGDLVLDADADMNDLIEATGNQPGRFLTFARDTDGRVLPQTGYVTVTPEHLGINATDDPYEHASIPVVMSLQHAYGVTSKALSMLESNALVQQQALQTLADCVAEMQRGGVAMIKEHSTTLRVANGMERIERDEPEVDVDELATRLNESIKNATKKKSPADWLPYVQMGAQAIKGLVQAFQLQPGAAPATNTPPRSPPAAPQSPPKPAVSSEPEYDEEFEEDDNFADDADFEAPDAVVCETAPPWYSMAPEPVRRETLTPAMDTESPNESSIGTETAENDASLEEPSEIELEELTQSAAPAVHAAADRQVPEHTLDATARPPANESPPPAERHEPPLLE